MSPSSSNATARIRRAWAPATIPCLLSLAHYGGCPRRCDAFSIPTLPSPTLPTRHAMSLSAAKTASDSSTASRLKRTSAFADWATENDIKYAGIEVSSGDQNSGLGLYATQSLAPNDVVIQVPTKLTLSVESPTDYNTAVERDLFPDQPKAYRNAPWWAALSIQLNYHDKVNPINELAGDGVSMRPWMESLPRAYDTPFHWSESSLEELQYRPMIEAVALQKKSWKKQYEDLARASSKFANAVSYDDFVWGSETARSRAFSGAYSGSAFNPVPYATVAVLVTAYLGLGIGSVEQAANGAALVVCGSILKDFVLPKLLKVRRYVICPLIDMANHRGIGASGNVAFEYFSDGFSLSGLEPGVKGGEEMFIQYGPRNNDQLLQYYGFVESDNVHDVYILPPIREWDIGALEEACGRTIGPGRLEKLDRAGLLGGSTAAPDDAVDVEARNLIGGVVLTRASGIDPAVVQALRALMSSESEWDEAGEAIGNFAAEVSPENERAARTAVRRAMEMELEGKATTAEEDVNLLNTLSGGKGGAADNAEEIAAVRFRLEKKKLLREAIDAMR